MRSIPSPSSITSSGEPTVSTQITCVRSVGERGEVAPREGLHPLHEGLLAAGRDQQHAHARDGLLGQAPREPGERGHAREVVVGAGTTPRAPISAKAAAVAKARTRAGDAHARAPQERARATSSGPPMTGHIRAASCRCAREAGKVSPTNTAAARARRAPTCAPRRGGRRPRRCAARRDRRLRRRRSTSGARAAGARRNHWRPPVMSSAMAAAAKAPAAQRAARGAR